jgi:hypothetical protein
MAIFVPLGFYFQVYSWLFWVAILFFFGMKHPGLVDPQPIGPARAKLAIATLFILVLCFTPTPIR